VYTGKHFVSALLRPDPAWRCTAAIALQHPWLETNLKVRGSVITDKPICFSNVTWGCVVRRRQAEQVRSVTNRLAEATIQDSVSTPGGSSLPSTPTAAGRVPKTPPTPQQHAKQMLLQAQAQQAAAQPVLTVMRPVPTPVVRLDPMRTESDEEEDDQPQQLRNDGHVLSSTPTRDGTMVNRLLKASFIPLFTCAVAECVMMARCRLSPQQRSSGHHQSSFRSRSRAQSKHEVHGQSLPQWWS